MIKEYLEIEYHIRNSIIDPLTANYDLLISTKEINAESEIYQTVINWLDANTPIEIEKYTHYIKTILDILKSEFITIKRKIEKGYLG